ncbi:MAG: AMP-binding protein [Planctomycetes bacterium]|nr:AMP-binding protein [Planctomycetota bacterium]
MIALREKGLDVWTFAELADCVAHLACGLVDAGVRAGEPVAMLASNRPEWVAACLAVIDAGAVATPLDVGVDDAHLTGLLVAAGARLVFATRDQAERLDRMSTGEIRRVAILDADKDDSRSWRRLLASGERKLPDIAPSDDAALFHTSGTTGQPKGVTLTHGNLAANVNALLAERLIGPGDRLFVPLPLHHVYPFTVGMLTALQSGAALVFPAGLTGPEVVRALRDAEVTAILAVPRFYESLLSAMEARFRGRGRFADALFHTALRASTAIRRRFGVRVGRFLFRPVLAKFGPRVRRVASGGAALATKTAWKLEGLGWAVCTGYGLTETSPILTANAGRTARFDTAGRPIRGVEIRIDSTDEATAGEVLARGPSVFSGYRAEPKTTADAFTRDGWFRTGDLGFRDGEGYLHLVGRLSERIVLADGKKIQPEDLEAAFVEGGPISEVAVLEMDSRLVALVVVDLAAAAAGGIDVAERVRSFVEERSRRLPPHQRVLDYAIATNALPRTPIGKLRRHLLPAIYERAKLGARVAPPGAGEPIARTPEDRDLLEHECAKRLWTWLTARFPTDPLALDTNLRLDLGVDSLEWVNLTLEMNDRAGVDLDEQAIARVHTVRDLLREARDSRGPRGLSPLEAPDAALDDEHRRWLAPVGPILAFVSAALMTVHRVFFRAFFRLRVIGAEKLPVAEPFIISPNHVSDLDPFALAAALPWRRLRNTYWGGATDRLFTNSAMRLLSRLARVVPVDPDAAVVSSLALGAAVLHRSHNLVWFPEGRRSLTGELEPFHPGVGLLLERFAIPVVPVFIRGTLEAMPRGAKFPRFRRVTVEFGDPIDARALAAAGIGANSANRIARALHDTVARLGGVAKS